jgi:hypothetical protein
VYGQDGGKCYHIVYLDPCRLKREIKGLTKPTLALKYFVITYDGLMSLKYLEIFTSNQEAEAF